MVTILSLAFTALSGTEQERCTSPLMCTEHAPHCATPQPYFVPVRPTCSRMTQRSGVSSSTRTSRALPLMFSLAICRLPRRLTAVMLSGVFGGLRPAAMPLVLLLRGSLAERPGPAYAVLIVP